MSAIPTRYSRTSHYSLSEGRYIQIVFPDAIPADEMEDVLLWIDLVKKQISRIGIAEPLKTELEIGNEPGKG